MVCGHSYVNSKIKARAERIRKAIAGTGLTITPNRCSSGMLTSSRCGSTPGSGRRDMGY